jgi:hypothetical protein
MKFVPYSHDKGLNGYFSLADAATNQVVASGSLRIHIYKISGLQIGSSGSALRMKNTFYDNAFAIGVSNFHWESFGSIFSVKDLVCRFRVPYSNFQIPVRRGQVYTLRVEFTPDTSQTAIVAERNVSLY